MSQRTKTTAFWGAVLVAMIGAAAGFTARPANAAPNPCPASQTLWRQGACGCHCGTIDLGDPCALVGAPACDACSSWGGHGAPAGHACEAQAVAAYSTSGYSKITKTSSYWTRVKSRIICVNDDVSQAYDGAWSSFYSSPSNDALSWVTCPTGWVRSKSLCKIEVL